MVSVCFISRKSDAKILLINWQEIYNSLKEPKTFESYYMVECQELLIYFIFLMFILETQMSLNVLWKLN